jgi:hypothetical protein
MFFKKSDTKSFIQGRPTEVEGRSSTISLLHLRQVFSFDEQCLQTLVVDCTVKRFTIVINCVACKARGVVTASYFSKVRLPTLPSNIRQGLKWLTLQFVKLLRVAFTAVNLLILWL